VKDDLQDMLSQTKQAQLENRLKDVAVLEEQMHQMLWGWKAELQAVPASSLLAYPPL
jgi:flagellar motility protein MotE (MotC chaperone)